jgi:DNA-binding NarL/FixJ family response regulator
VAHLDRALALADACAAPYERALTLLALAELRLVGAHREAAGVALDQARATCAQLQARPALTQCAVLAARLHSDAPAPAEGARAVPPPRYPARLTAREVEVLRLIAAGQSNREMAAALCRSERTIERHIENIYRKIDAHSKADATAFAFRHGLA